MHRWTCYLTIYPESFFLCLTSLPALPRLPLGSSFPCWRPSPSPKSSSHGRWRRHAQWAIRHAATCWPARRRGEDITRACYITVMAYRHDCTQAFTRHLSCDVSAVIYIQIRSKCLRECTWHKFPRMRSRVWVCPCSCVGICHSFRVCVSSDVRMTEREREKVSVMA